jgi:hypothetical protein
VKPPVICPAATVTLVGTVRFALFEASETDNPPAGATELKVTVHALFPGVLIVAGAQFRPVGLTDTGSEIDPELPEPGIELPAAVEATTPLIPSGIGLAEGLDAIWNVATATVPSAMTFEFKPKIKQVLPEQLTDLPALVAELPATTVTLVMSDEKLNENSRPAV